MKKQIVMTLILLVAGVFFYSCEKEQFEAPVTDSQKMDGVEQNAAVAIEGAKIDGIDTLALDLNTEVESRSGRQLIYQEVMTINQSHWWMKIMYKFELSPDYQYIAVVTPYFGDPDLYVHGKEVGYYTPFRAIRSNKRAGFYSEEVFVTFDDLRANEDELYFNIYAASYTRCKIQIYREPICRNGCLAGKYYLQSALGTYIDVQGYNSAPSANVQTYTFHGGINQRWSLVDAGNNQYFLQSDLGTYMDVKDFSSAPGANVQTYTLHGGNNQRWYVVPTNDGYYYIQSAVGTFLDVQGFNSAPGANVQTYTWHGGINQKWKLIKR